MAGGENWDIVPYLFRHNYGTKIVEMRGGPAEGPIISLSEIAAEGAAHNEIPGCRAFSARIL